MWQCLNCGKRINDEFDACWNCGTAQNGTPNSDFHAEPDDPAAPDRGPDPEPPPETPEDAEAARLRRERIVELCSVGDAAEAEGLCELLDESGIQARVVGECLRGAAGSLPFGETISPRVWVFASDAARAQEILERHFQELENEPEESPDDSSDEEEIAEPEVGELPSDVRFRFLSQGFFIVALVIVAFGAIWAWVNWTTLSTWAVADGKPIDAWRVHGNLRMPGGPDQPFGKRHIPTVRLEVEYAYRVNGHFYFAGVKDAANDLAHVPIYYNPRQPAEHVVGPIAPPWVILLFALGIGAFLSFVGYQFR